MRDLTYDLVQLSRHYTDGSYATQHDRRRMLRLISKQLTDLGYKQLRARDLKGRHVNKLLSLWESQDLSAGTIRNRMTVLRWWAEKVGRESVVSQDNAQYGIPPRMHHQVSRALDLGDEVLKRIDGVHADYIRYSLRLQRAFGLRREESIKFMPSYAIQRDEFGSIESIRLKGSWTKGGRPREIQVRTRAQLELLEEVAQFAKGGSLIPGSLRYIDHLKKFEYRTRKAGLDRKHGLRHQYAQERYKELTGWDCPLKGWQGLTDEQKIRDREVRDLISQELGHERRTITDAYLGRWMIRPSNTKGTAHHAHREKPHRTDTHRKGSRPGDG